MMLPVSELVTFIAAYRRDQTKKCYRSSEERGREGGRKRGRVKERWLEVHRKFHKEGRDWRWLFRVGGL